MSVYVCGCVSWLELLNVLWTFCGVFGFYTSKAPNVKLIDWLFAWCSCARGKWWSRGGRLLFLSSIMQQSKRKSDLQKTLESAMGQGQLLTRSRPSLAQTKGALEPDLTCLHDSEESLEFNISKLASLHLVCVSLVKSTARIGRLPIAATNLSFWPCKYRGNTNIFAPLDACGPSWPESCVRKTQFLAFVRSYASSFNNVICGPKPWRTLNLKKP